MPEYSFSKYYQDLNKVWNKDSSDEEGEGEGEDDAERKIVHKIARVNKQASASKMVDSYVNKLIDEGNENRSIAFPEFK